MISLNLFRSHLLLCLVALFCACNNAAKDENKIIVSGTINASPNSKIYFFTYPDTLTMYSENKVPADTAVIDAEGKYSFEISSTHPLVFNIEDGKHELVTNLFACPGDHIEVSFSGKENSPRFNIGTIEGKFNAYLMEFIDSFYRSPEVKHVYYIATNYMDGHIFAGYNEKRKQSQHSFYDDYFKGIDLRKEYKDYALNAIDYGIAVDRLMYVYKKRIKSQPLVLDNDYFNFETPSFIENQFAFSSPPYIRFLNLYILDTYERMVERGELKSTIERRLDPSVEKYKLAVKLLNRPYRDAVLYNIIRGDMNEIGSTNASSGDNVNIPVDSLINWFKKKHSLQE